MIPLTSMERGGVLGRMFPHTLRVRYTCSYVEGNNLLDMHDVVESVDLPEVPCSVQCTTAVNGAVLDTDYVILSPCLDFSGVENVRVEGGTDGYVVLVTMNGREYTASGDEIVEVDNRETHKVCGVAIGCCIKIKLSAGRWVFGR